jgi:hypothetical protein
MLFTSRRRALALLIASLGLGFAPALRRALAVEPEEGAPEEEPAEGEDAAADGEAGDEELEEPTGPPECYDSKKFGDWLGRATDKLAGARINDVPFDNPDESPLRADVHVSSSYDCKLVLYADTDKVELSKAFLVDPQNRLIVRDENGKDALDIVLCGNCADIEEDLVSIFLPLSTVPLLRERPAISIAIKLNGHDETGFKLKLDTMREAIDWAEDRQKELADDAVEGVCIRPQPE